MENTSKNPLVMDACLNQNKLFERLKSVNKKLETIMKALNLYLNTKRDAFPRFYFLSNEDLLSILSNTNNPMAVQKHMIKCFEGI